MYGNKADSIQSLVIRLKEVLNGECWETWDCAGEMERMVALGNREEFGCGSPCLPVGSGQDGFLPPLCNLCPQQSSWMHFGRTGRMGHWARGRRLKPLTRQEIKQRMGQNCQAYFRGWVWGDGGLMWVSWENRKGGREKTCNKYMWVSHDHICKGKDLSFESERPELIDS